MDGSGDDGGGGAVGVAPAELRRDLAVDGGAKAEEGGGGADGRDGDARPEVGGQQEEGAGQQVASSAAASATYSGASFSAAAVDFQTPERVVEPYEAGGWGRVDPSQGDVDRPPTSPSSAAAADDREPGDPARGCVVGLLEAGRGALSFCKYAY